MWDMRSVTALDRYYTSENKGGRDLILRKRLIPCDPYPSLSLETRHFYYPIANQSFLERKGRWKGKRHNQYSKNREKVTKSSVPQLGDLQTNRFYSKIWSLTTLTCFVIHYLSIPSPSGAKSLDWKERGFYTKCPKKWVENGYLLGRLGL